MHKDFDSWNEKKKLIEGRFSHIIFRERDIWWCSVGINVGNESCGKGKDFQRPVIILKKLNQKSFIGLPCSTKPHKGSWFYTVRVNNTINYISLHQVRMFDVNRLQRQITHLKRGDYIEIKQKLEKLLEL